MTAWITANFPIVLALSIFLLLWIFLGAFRTYHFLKKRQPPFTRSLLRAPGQSLLREIEHLSGEIIVYVGYLCLAPMLMYALYVSRLYFYEKTPSLLDAAVLGGFVFLLIVYCFVRLKVLLRRRRRLRLGYEGEVAVGQELNQLLRDGYHVYHDFPAGKFNIDHIVVGPKGIFAVETKARSKPDTGRGTEDATVAYNGRILQFPTGTDTESTKQTRLRAQWLSEWIGGAIGEPVAARGILALPGWFVKRTSPEGIPVVNPRQFPSLFRHIQPRALSEEIIARIVHQLEQKCRDVEPDPA
jgi:hypothetical protein